MQGERERLGNALIARADDVADAVRVRVWPQGTDGIDPVALAAIEDADRASTRMIGNWLVGGQQIDEEDRRKLGELGRMINRLTLGELTKSYLAWRDALLAVMYEEAVRLGTSPELVAEVATVIARNNDGSVVRMARRFDEERRRLQEVLARQATYDALTGLPNRTLLFDRIGHALTVSRRTGRELALLFVDLDGFKGVNDRLGHQAGDELLITVAKRLSDVVREADTVARLGGDEFVVLCEDLEGGHNPAEIAERVIVALERPVVLERGATVSISASIGIGHAEPGDSPSELVMRADGAMYAAKQGGRGRYETALPDRLTV
jgi:diguanylate cyclase (GGDEF)-like protein